MYIKSGDNCNKGCACMYSLFEKRLQSLTQLPINSVELSFDSLCQVLSAITMLCIFRCLEEKMKDCKYYCSKRCQGNYLKSELLRSWIGTCQSCLCKPTLDSVFSSPWKMCAGHIDNPSFVVLYEVIHVMEAFIHPFRF